MIDSKDLIAGTTWKWSESFEDYPSADYNCKVIIKLGTDAAVEIAATASLTYPQGFDFEKAASFTAQCGQGDYQFQYIFTAKVGGAVYAPKEFSGYTFIDVLLNSNNDTRSEEQKVLDLLIDARTKIAGRDYIEISIGGKTAKFKSLQEIDSAIISYKKKLGIYKTPKIISRFV